MALELHKMKQGLARSSVMLSSSTGSLKRFSNPIDLLLRFHWRKNMQSILSPSSVFTQWCSALNYVYRMSPSYLIWPKRMVKRQQHAVRFFFLQQQHLRHEGQVPWAGASSKTAISLSHVSTSFFRSAEPSAVTDFGKNLSQWNVESLARLESWFYLSQLLRSIP